MKSQVKKAITLSGGAAVLVLAVGFGGYELSPSGTTPTGSSSIALAYAGEPPCITDSTNPCPQVAGDVTNSPSPPPMQIICRPAGTFGQHCYRR